MPVGQNEMPSARKGSNKVWDDLPEDDYQCQVLDVNADVDTDFETGEPKEIYLITLVIVDREKRFVGKHNGDQAVYGRRIWYRTPSRTCSPPAKNPASALYKFAKCAFNRELQESEVYDRFDPNTLIGQQVKVETTNRVSGKTGKVYQKVTHVSKVNRQMLPFNPDDFKRDDADAAPAGARRTAGELLDDVPF